MAGAAQGEAIEAQPEHEHQHTHITKWHKLPGSKGCRHKCCLQTAFHLGLWDMRVLERQTVAPSVSAPARLPCDSHMYSDLTCVLGSFDMYLLKILLACSNSLFLTQAITAWWEKRREMSQVQQLAPLQVCNCRAWEFPRPLPVTLLSAGSCLKSLIFC